MKKLIILLAASNIMLPVMTYILTKKYYEKRINKEVTDRVNSMLPELMKAVDISSEEPQKEEPKPEEKKEEGIEPKNPPLNDMVKRYSDYTSYYASESKEESEKQEEPPHRLNKVREIIDDVKLGERWGLESIETYNLYSDHVLTDSDNNIVTDPDETVGADTIKNFRVHVKNGSVCVRNYELETDYEILDQPRRYADIHKE